VEPHPLVALIAANPGMAARLLAQHTNDGTDHCTSCVQLATGARQIWPCPSHGLAAAALTLRPADSAKSHR
jgi:hypothetical protein